MKAHNQETDNPKAATRVDGNRSIDHHLSLMA